MRDELPFVPTEDHSLTWFGCLLYAGSMFILVVFIWMMWGA